MYSFFIQKIQTTLQTYSFRLNFFSNKKLGIGTSFAQLKKDLDLIGNRNFICPIEKRS